MLAYSVVSYQTVETRADLSHTGLFESILVARVIGS